mmetsp:Transcript_63734/g.149690  ORF Transcript_63734/g.149690 Transcript_63734/m.149690 type:complete len:248 (-) Transcript_63734:302-1045(-)
MPCPVRSTSGRRCMNRHDSKRLLGFQSLKVCRTGSSWNTSRLCLKANARDGEILTRRLLLLRSLLLYHHALRVLRPPLAHHGTALQQSGAEGARICRVTWHMADLRPSALQNIGLGCRVVAQPAGDLKQRKPRRVMSRCEGERAAGTIRQGRSKTALFSSLFPEMWRHATRLVARKCGVETARCWNRPPNSEGVGALLQEGCLASFRSMNHPPRQFYGGAVSRRVGWAHNSRGRLKGAFVCNGRGHG